MITKNKFNQIYLKVKNAVESAFLHCRNVCRDDKFMAYLADGEFEAYLNDPNVGFNPNTIDNSMDHYRDESRVKFLLGFIRTFYSFPNSTNEILDDEYRLNLELMIYTHIWESKHLLKNLYRLTQLALDNAYPWKVPVPEFTKHKFFRNEIRDGLKKVNLDIADVISKGFNSQFRNAFAHSDYVIDSGNKRINFYSDGGFEPHEVPFISFDDWNERFVYSFLLSYHLFHEKQKQRISFFSHSRDSEFGLVLPTGNNGSKYVKLIYDRERDLIRFK